MCSEEEMCYFKRLKFEVLIPLIFLFFMPFIVMLVFKTFFCLFYSLQFAHSFEDNTRGGQPCFSNKMTKYCSYFTELTEINRLNAHQNSCLLQTQTSIQTGS